jgi:disulfide bond formation protein DsbB
MSLHLAQPAATRRDPLPALIALACLAAIGAALVSQHVFDMQPCPWCVLQRLIFALIALAGLAAWAANAPVLRRVALGLVLPLALAGVSAGDAVAATLAYRLAAYWLPLPVGAVAYVVHSRIFPARVRAAPG